MSINYYFMSPVDKINGTRESYAPNLKPQFSALSYSLVSP